MRSGANAWSKRTSSVSFVDACGASSRPVPISSKSPPRATSARATFCPMTPPPPVISIRISSFLDRACHAGDVVLDEKRVQDDHRDRTEQRTGHQRAPVIDVAFHELGDDSDRHGLYFRRRYERERVDELVP